MNIRWTDGADRTFQQQTEWLRETRNEAAVTRYFEEVAAALDKLEKSDSVQYQLVHEESGTRRLPVNKTIDLYYRLDAGEVELVTFFHNRQDPGKLRF